MKTNKLNLSLLIGLAITIFLISVVSSTPLSLSAPATDAAVTSNVTLRAQNGTDVVAGIMNCTFYARSSLTANSSNVNLGLFSNVTAMASEVNGSFISNYSGRYLEDANNYIFNATCLYLNGTNESVTNTGIRIDNTRPNAATSLTPTLDTDGTVNFSSTVVGTNTTSCLLVFTGKGPGVSNYTMTHGGNICTHTLSNVPEETYVWFIRTSDETNTTNSATQNTRVDVSTGAGKGVIFEEVEEIGIAKIGGVPIIVIIIGVIVIIFFIIKRRS